MNSKSLFWSVFSFISLIQYQVQSQVIEDKSLSTEVETVNNQNFTINEGEQRGNNLFHSFNEFSIPDNGSVFFNNALTIQNIISRVTGSSISEINGLIQSNGTADIFLINPNGIIFGENATLDIGGSFIGTTAESLFFGDGTEFSADLSNPQSLLTVSVPLGLQFGSDPGKIINKADLSIANPLDSTGQDQIKLGLTTIPNKTFALLGNGITFDGGAVTSPVGNIQLGSVAANSFVTLEPITEGWDINYDAVDQFQDIKLDNLASIDTSGEGGGDIDLTGRNIQIFNGSAITSNTLGDIDGRTIQIQASDLVEIDGSDRTGTKLDPFLASVEIFLPSASQISTNTFGSGKGGDINIAAEDLKLIDGGIIELRTFPDSLGKAGDLTIIVGESIDLAGIRPLLGVGENVADFLLPTVTSDIAIEINQASRIGNISLGNEDGGNITISSDNIRLQDGSSIVVTPFGSGNAGNIKIDARESLQIIGTSPRTGSTSSVVSSNTFATGTSGNIEITTEKLTIIDGGQILSSTSSISDAGDIEINTSSIEISGFRVSDQIPSLISAQATGGGDGGNISLNTDSLTISDRAGLSVQGSGASVPGNLTVNADEVELSNFGSITAETEFESGGNIQLNIQDRLTLRENSLISAEAFNNADGGNLDLDARFIIAFPQENSDILANAVFGNGGNIMINTEGIFGLEERRSNPPNLTNDIDASSEFGTAGTVSIFFPGVSKLEGTFQAPSNTVDADHLFKNNFCKIRGDNRFVATGRNGIPRLPNDLTLAQYSWTDWRMVETEGVEKIAKVAEEAEEVAQGEKTTAAKKLTMIQGWVVDHEGNVILTDKPLTVASRKTGLSSPDCHTIYQKY